MQHHTQLNILEWNGQRGNSRTKRVTCEQDAHVWNENRGNAEERTREATVFIIYHVRLWSCLVAFTRLPTVIQKKKFTTFCARRFGLENMN